EPRQLRLPGFTRLWAWRSAALLESARIRLRQRQPLRTIRQGIFIPVRAIEQQHPLVPSDHSALQRQPPRRQHRTPFGTEEEAVVLCRIADSFDDHLFWYCNRCAPTVADRAQNEEVAD